MTGFDEAKWNKGIADLAEAGLNVFASVKVARLPDDILAAFEKSGISFSPSQSLGLLGHGGKTLWRHLPHPLNSAENPVDAYTSSQLQRFKEEGLQGAEITVIYPHRDWTVPLQRLGRFLNVARPSRLGLDIHPLFGPWFAYRCAFLTEQSMPEIMPAAFASPCEDCVTQPCRGACPAQAVTVAVFELAKCADFRLARGSSCIDRCHARMACPVGKEHHYELGQIQYHMLRPAHLSRLASYGTAKTKI